MHLVNKNKRFATDSRHAFNYDRCPYISQNLVTLKKIKILGGGSVMLYP